jgi:hypothetical protein
MRFTKLATAGILVLAVGGMAACHSGPEGKYSLDKTEMKKQMETKVAKLPKEQQAFAKLATAMIDAMNMEVELQSGGKLHATSTKPAFEKGKPAKTESKDGTWHKDGEKLILTIDGKDLKCDQTGKSLSCTGDKPGEPPMVFVKS